MINYPSILIIGKPETEKNRVINNILYHYRKIPTSITVYPTETLNLFSDFCKCYDINKTILKNILIRQSMMIDRIKMSKKKKKLDQSTILVMDDCLTRKKSWTKDKNVMEISMYNRCYMLIYVLTMQTIRGLVSDLCLNFNYVFLLKEDSVKEKIKLWKKFGSTFESFAIFEKIFDECTKDNRVMVIDNLQNTIFWFRADEDIFNSASDKSQTKFIKWHYAHK
jgi:hypothetical protein